MREIVWDTETTGLDPRGGDRIVEIGAVELERHVPTGRTFHEYLDPQRAMSPEAFAVHGLGDDFLRGKPLFEDVGPAFLDFVGDAVLVAHNAAFDLGFINAELGRARLPLIPEAQIVDSLALAKRRFPGARNSLDALCARFGIDNSGREKHGALLDSEILAEVYLELIGGKQPALVLETGGARSAGPVAARTHRARPAPLPPRITPEEAAAHAAHVEELGEGAIWRRQR